MHERTLIRRSRRNSVGLRDHFLEKDFWRHESLSHAFSHLHNRLVKQNGKKLQPRNVVLVIFDIFEGKNADQLRSVDVSSAALVDRQFPWLEARAFKADL